MKSFTGIRFICHTILCMGILLCGISCNEVSSGKDTDTSHNSAIVQRSDSNFVQEPSFFVDSTLTIVSTDKTTNGYSVKILATKDSVLMNLTRGDSINKSVVLHNLPGVYFWPLSDLIGEDMYGKFHLDSIGTIYRDIAPMVHKTELLPSDGIFFMDVNFDGEEELIVEHEGYNRHYYACFDIVNGKTNGTPGILPAMDEPPFDNIVTATGTAAINTEFDFKEKTIHIYEQMGCSTYIETWCKLMSDNKWEKPSVKIIRIEHNECTIEDGHWVKKIYERENEELVLKKTEPTENPIRMD